MRKVSLLLCGIGCLALGFVDDASAAKRPYRYVPLDAAVPDGFDSFVPVSISDGRRIYGTLSTCTTPDECSPSVAVFSRGKIAVLHEGFAASANNRATVGGGVVLDPDQHTTQAALFTNTAVKLIPPLHNDEFTSAVRLLTDTRIAFVDSLDTNFELSQYLTRRGNVTPLDFGEFPDHLDMNDRGRISGTFRRQDGDRAFRYAPFSGQLGLLEPRPTEPNSWGQAINSHGHVLGYSFVFGGRERIGVWRGTRFRTYFVEGTAQFPTVSNRLLWNEQGLIVITDTTDLNSYLVPRPGVRLKLADLTRGPLPAWTDIIDINNNGDLVGVGGARRFEVSSVFLLRRVGALDGNGEDAESVAASSPTAVATRARARHAPVLERLLHEGLYERLAIRKDRSQKSASLRRG